jgi:hypothetical protein
MPNSKIDYCSALALGLDFDFLGVFDAFRGV